MKKGIKIFISSPGDVLQERIIARNVVAELNTFSLNTFNLNLLNGKISYCKP